MLQSFTEDLSAKLYNDSRVYLFQELQYYQINKQSSSYDISLLENY